MAARHVIEEAIEAWRDGETADAIHPQPDLSGSPWLWNPDTVKDLARVIRNRLEADGDGKAP